MSLTLNMVGGGGGGGSAFSDIVVAVTNGNATSVTGVKGDKTANFVQDAHVFPVGYTELEYLQGINVQGIDTGIIGNQDTRVKAKAIFPQTAALFGARQAVNQRAYAFLLTGTGFFRTDYGSNQGNFDSSITTTTKPVIIDKNKNVTTITIDGTTTTNTVSYSSFTTPGNIRLMGFNNNGTIDLFTGTLYYAEIYSNGTLVRNFVPARRISDSALGFYDTVNDVFYTNSSETGTLIAGPDIIYPWRATVSTGVWTITATDGTHTQTDTINATEPTESLTLRMQDIPNAYTQLEYIQSDASKSQYVNLGTLGRFRAVVSLMFMDSNSNGGGFGSLKSGNRNFLNIYKYNSDNRMHFQFGWGPNNEYKQDTSYPISAGTKYSLDVSFVATNVFFKLNGNTIQASTTTSSATTNIDDYLLALNSDGSVLYPGSMRLYDEMEIYNASGTLIRDLFPAKRNSDDVVGLYDIVNDVFYTNQGTGDFTAGPAA